MAEHVCDWCGSNKHVTLCRVLSLNAEPYRATLCRSCTFTPGIFAVTIKENQP